MAYNVFIGWISQNIFLKIIFCKFYKFEDRGHNSPTVLSHYITKYNNVQVIEMIHYSDRRSVSDRPKARGYPCAKGYNSSASLWLCEEQVRLRSGHPKVHFGTIVEGSGRGGGGGGVHQVVRAPWLYSKQTTQRSHTYQSACKDESIVFFKVGRGMRWRGMHLVQAEISWNPRGMPKKD